ncbi:MAG: hypothetical protein R3D05_01800 [Dongiaceae bacterium]
MLCCAMGVAAIATGTIGWRQFRRLFRGEVSARSALSAVVVTAIAITVAGVVTDHLRRHAAYADGGQSLPTALTSLPLCRGGVAEGTTRIASIKE